MNIRKTLLTAAISVALFAVMCGTYIFGLPDKVFKEVKVTPNGECSFYESENVDLIGFSENDIAFSDTAFRGGSVYVNVKGEAGKAYSIKVFTPSGKSGSSVFESKRADENGNVHWTWKVSDNISDGYIRVIVFGENEYAQIKMKIR